MAPDFKAWDSSKLAQAVVHRLAERGETLALAESCTGGLLSARIAALPGVSAVYLGSIVAYSNHIKERLLDVPRPLILTMGAVSLPVARRMAIGARARFESTWALGVTGVAGPSGGSPQKPVGTVCFGVSGPGFEDASSAFFEGARFDIQSASADHALRLLFEQIAAV